MNEHRPDPTSRRRPGDRPGAGGARPRAARRGGCGARSRCRPRSSARLDDTLAMLRAERVAVRRARAADETTSADDPRPRSGNVVPLRRRWLPRAAGAAAAVIVLGVGGLAAVRLGTDDPQDSAASGGAASDTSPLSPAPSEAPVPSAGSAESPGSEARTLRESAGAVRALPAVTTASFDTDVAALLRRGAVVTPGERTAGRPSDQSGDQPTDQPTDRPRADVRGSTSGDSQGSRPPPRAGPERCSVPARARRSPTAPWPTRCASTASSPCWWSIPAKDGEQLVEAWTCQGDRGWTAPS